MLGLLPETNSRKTYPWVGGGGVIAVGLVRGKSGDCRKREEGKLIVELCESDRPRSMGYCTTKS